MDPTQVTFLSFKKTCHILSNIKQNFYRTVESSRFVQKCPKQGNIINFKTTPFLLPLFSCYLKLSTNLNSFTLFTIVFVAGLS